jgi:hypothetical protein
MGSQEAHAGSHEKTRKCRPGKHPLISDAHLGGEDFDNDLVNPFVQEFKSKNKKGEYNLFYL